MPSKFFYITTTLPYVNAPPHIGFALEITRADILARYHRLLGEDVFFNTGTDEHGLKIYRAAKREGKELQQYVDEYAAKFDRLKQALNLSYNNFIRTTDPHHIRAAQEFWRRCEKSGDIYKKFYQIRYCVECELEKTESELENGHCIIHPYAEIEIIEEENYFFKFTNYQDRLLQLYQERPDFVIPEKRLNEIKKFVEAGLEDFSISRLKAKMPWGVPVPGDDAHVMYVWFDALVGYISAIGWPKDKKKFEKFWGTKDDPNAIQFAGKDNLRQQSAMWQAMLTSANLPSSKQIYIEGFITSGGEKMSKSRGNVIDPFELVEKYGTDSVRYYLAHHIHPFEDSDFTEEKFREAYNAHLANGLGNLTARIMKLGEVHLDKPIAPPDHTPFPKEFTDAIVKFEFNQAMDFIWGRIQALDRRIAEEQPFVVVRDEPEKGKTIITELQVELHWIARMLQPFMPGTSDLIKDAIKLNKMPESLFPRLE
ncbi:MAG: methionine--tRNA ligase [Candidatus Colwellbacteria bacterium]|nr:methionine--tRNA ligase [Candidatus Colwellbacteria bacterium]